MARKSNLWGPVLAALLVAVLVGAPGAKEAAFASAEPRVTTANLMVPAPAFVPIEDGTGYFVDFSGSFLEVGDGVAAHFVAPVRFPVPAVSVKKITLYAYDNDGTFGICLWLRRVAPVGAETTVFMGSLCTEGGNDTRPQVLTTTAISPRQVNTAGQGLVLEVALGPGTRLYGVKVTYSY